LAGTAHAAGNLVTGATAINTTITPDFKLNGDKFELETGKYYRWNIKCDAKCDNQQFSAAELWANSYVSQIKVGDMEIHQVGPGVYIEFDGAGEIDVYFVVQKTGVYPFTLSGKSAAGSITAK